MGRLFYGSGHQSHLGHRSLCRDNEPKKYGLYGQAFLWWCFISCLFKPEDLQNYICASLVTLVTLVTSFQAQTPLDLCVRPGSPWSPLFRGGVGAGHLSITVSYFWCFMSCLFRPEHVLTYISSIPVTLVTIVTSFQAQTPLDLFVRTGSPWSPQSPLFRGVCAGHLSIIVSFFWCFNSFETSIYAILVTLVTSI